MCLYICHACGRERTPKMGADKLLLLVDKLILQVKKTTKLIMIVIFPSPYFLVQCYFAFLSSTTVNVLQTMASISWVCCAVLLYLALFIIAPISILVPADGYLLSDCKLFYYFMDQQRACWRFTESRCGNYICQQILR